MAARSISNALFLSRGMRQDTSISVVLQGTPKGSDSRPTEVTWTGSEVVGLWPDDKSIAAKLQKAICNMFGWPQGAGKPSEPQVGQKRKEREEQIAGIKVGKTPFAQFVREQLLHATGGREFVSECDADGTVVCERRWPGACPIYFHETGMPVRDYFDALPTDAAQTKFVVMIGGPTGLSPDEESTVEELGFQKVSFGDPSLFASHCIVLTNHYIDSWCNSNGIKLQTEPAGKPKETANPWRKQKKQVYN